MQPHELVNSFDYKWTATGENIWYYQMQLDSNSKDYNHFLEIYRSNITASKIVEGWMNSPGHKANILKSNYGNIGVGIVYSAVGRTYVTQEFSN